MKAFPTLYKRDSKGKLREWRAEVDGAKYRIVSGLSDGQQVTSEWKTTVAKNVGRANATTAEEQAVAEVEALYTKRLDGEYHRDPGNVDQARFFKPMLASDWAKRKDKIEYPVFVQPKLDGLRCIANRDGLWSRTGKKFVSCPHIESSLAPLFATDPNLVLDGELYNHELKDDFNKIISMVRKTKPSADDIAESAEKVRFHVYDIPSDGRVFTERTAALASLILGRFKDSLELVSTLTAESEEEVDELFAAFVEVGYEGGIIRLNTEYEQKRSRNLLKRKDFQDSEYTIVSIEEGSGNWAGYAKRIVFQLDNNRTATATLKGSQEYCAEVLANREQYVGGQVTVQYFNLTPDGVPRFPVAKTIYPGTRDM